MQAELSNPVSHLAVVALLAVLTALQMRSTKLNWLRYWTAAWVSQSLALWALLTMGSRATAGGPWLTPFLLGQYSFGLLVVAACHSHGRADGRIAAACAWLLVPAGLLALALPRVVSRIDLVMIPHHVVLAGLLLVARISCRGALSRQGGMAASLLPAALGLLSAFFLISALLRLHPDIRSSALLGSMLSPGEMLIDILLGFAVAMSAMEGAKREVEAANRELIESRQRLEGLARVDALTQALNRHALYSLMENKRISENQSLSGCVVVLDIDNLKPINDGLGHSAGDAAIRSVAGAVRALIRPYDLLFRWGGDEFLVLLFHVTKEGVRPRFQKLNATLAQTALPGSPAPVPVSVSYGIHPFGDTTSLEQSIEEADKAMYARKRARKEGMPTSGAVRIRPAADPKEPGAVP
ncbi:MAG: GGDEF domain-containing protein [Acidobacteria bacterium]|nr:GGDEF domain-containing protein [Acidobacteriota bacterium]